MKFFRKGNDSAPALDFDLDTPVFNLTPGNPMSIRDLCEGCFICGSTGSGKSTGSLYTIITSLMKMGFGMLLTTTKITDFEEYKQWAIDAGRGDDVVRFCPAENHRFNPFLWEMSRKGEGAGISVNLVRLFEILLEISERESGSGKGSDDSYWKYARGQLLRNLCDLAILARGQVSLSLLSDILASMPRSIEERKSKNWQANSLCFTLILEAQHKQKQGLLSETQSRDLHLTVRFIISEFPKLSPRTRTSIESMVTSMMDNLNRGYMHELFGQGVNCSPDDTFTKQSIIIIDMPVKEFAELGLIANGIWKFCYQKSVERRDLKQYPLPVALICDEFQAHTNSFDILYQATARGSRSITIYATQSYSSVLDALGGGESAKAATDSLLSNLNIKIGHSTNDPVTSEWLTSVVGRWWTTKLSVGSTITTDGSRMRNSNASETLENIVEPYSYSLLRKGGPANQNIVEAIVCQTGRRFSNGQTYILAEFKQPKR